MSNESPKGWTVMVYMADRNNLQPYAAVDLAEMAKIGSSDKLRVLVQVGTSVDGQPLRFIVHKNKCEMCAPLTASSDDSSQTLGAARVGNPSVLREFLEFGLKYQAEHYLLILWGHFIGIGFGKVGNDALTLSELTETLAWFKGQRNGKPLDILGGDTCNMSFAEAAYQLRDVADFMVTSELPTQFAGWPYEKVLGAIANAHGTIAPKKLGRAIVERYIDSYKPPSVSLTLLSLAHADDLKQSLKDLVDELTRVGAAGNQRHVLTIIKAFNDTAHGKVRALIDLLDLCKKIERRCHDAKLRRATLAAISALEQGSEKLVTFYKSNVRSTPAMNGLGIFAPFVTTRADWFTQQISERNYKDLDLANETSWGDFVYGLTHVMHGE
jgi:Clostripain family